MTKPVYRPLPAYEDPAEVERLLAQGSWEQLMLLPLGVGWNWPDWRYAQSVCLRLAEHQDAAIRANACQGLSYIAQRCGRLDKRLVRPVLLRELRTQVEFRWRIEEALADINHFLHWRIGQRSRS